MDSPELEGTLANIEFYGGLNTLSLRPYLEVTGWRNEHRYEYAFDLGERGAPIYANLAATDLLPVPLEKCHLPVYEQCLPFR